MKWLLRCWQRLTGVSEQHRLTIHRTPSAGSCRDPIRYIGDPRDIYLA